MALKGERLCEIYRGLVGAYPLIEQNYLLQQLQAFQSQLPTQQSDPIAFHRAFRTQRVTDQDARDMSIWAVMHLDDKIWAALDKWYEEENV